MPRIPQPPSLKSKSLRFGNKNPKVVACSEKCPQINNDGNKNPDGTNNGN
jgi:hypothetical protein